MSAIGSGFSPEGKPKVIDRENWPAMIQQQYAEEKALAEEELCSADLLVELPFWILIPESEFEVSYNESKLNAQLLQDQVAVYDGPVAFSSHKNLVFIAEHASLSDKMKEAPLSKISAPVYRPMRTTVRFETRIPPSLIQSQIRRNELTPDDYAGIRHVNRAMQYFAAVASAHLPYVNRVITSYRSVSFDPFAFSVAEFDVPMWFIRRADAFCAVNLMPYSLNDDFPGLGRFGSEGNRRPVYTATADLVQSQCKKDVAPGKLELLDAKSLLCRGRYEDAIRSVVTAIEVALEHQTASLLRRKGNSENEVAEQLEKTRSSFFERLKFYERLVGRRTPGPVLSYYPHINGLRLKQELHWVRTLRHKIVHEGQRVDIFSRGTATRAVETLTWFYQFLEVQDPYGVREAENYAFYGAMIGVRAYYPEHSDKGIRIRTTHLSEQPEEPIETIEDLLFKQYLKSLSVEKADFDLFVAMSLDYLGIEFGDAPPNNESGHSERFLMKIDGRQMNVHCIEASGKLELSDLQQVVAERAYLASAHTQSEHVVIIVNHDKSRPIRQRIVEPFSESVLQHATEAGFTLVAASDLHRLVRSQLELGCTLIDGSDFSEPGRQFADPIACEHAGIVRKVFPMIGVVSIELVEARTLSTGDTIAFELRDRFVEVQVTSLERDKKSVPNATGPCRIGVKSNLPNDLTAECRVFSRKTEA